ncbi:hypothetical protein T492DRAFT_888389 [Pavlovales sp. CCMP2436]|nr:hypothetical protein T492DRAFT_888389 [Pavlovales sp. CCMP2436]
MRQEIGMCALRGHAKVFIARARMENIGGGGAAHGGADDDGTEEWTEGLFNEKKAQAAEAKAQAAKAAEGPRAQAAEAAKEAKESKAQAAEAAKEATAQTAKAKAQAKPTPTPTPTSSTPRSTPTHRSAPPAKLQHTDSRVENETNVGVNDSGHKVQSKTKGTGKKDNASAAAPTLKPTKPAATDPGLSAVN